MGPICSDLNSLEIGAISSDLLSLEDMAYMFRFFEP